MFASSCSPPRPPPLPSLSLCACGRPITAYLIDQNRYVCEQCQATEIYRQESYKRIVDKVWAKVSNLMKMRMQMCQVFHQQRGRSRDHHHGFCPGTDINNNVLQQPSAERCVAMELEKTN